MFFMCFGEILKKHHFFIVWLNSCKPLIFGAAHKTENLVRLIAKRVQCTPDTANSLLSNICAEYQNELFFNARGTKVLQPQRIHYFQIFARSTKMNFSLMRVVRKYWSRSEFIFSKSLRGILFSSLALILVQGTKFTIIQSLNNIYHSWDCYIWKLIGMYIFGTADIWRGVHFWYSRDLARGTNFCCAG